MIRKNPCNSTKKALRGMTLVELLITIAILGILAAVVYPSYTKHIQASHRASAKADLIKLQLYLEQHYDAGNTNYTGGYDHAVVNNNRCAKIKCDSESGRYHFRITRLGTNAGTNKAFGYQLTATPQGAQVGDKCNAMTLKSNGEATPEECW